MILSTAAATGDPMRTVFIYFGIFWVVALVVLYVAVGVLTKRADLQRAKHDAHH